MKKTPTEKLYSFIDIFISIVRIVFLSKFIIQFPLRTKEIDTLYVLGNGPSLKNTLLKRDSNSRYLAVNQFCNTPFFKELKPDFYVLNAPEYWLPNMKEVYVKNREQVLNAFSEISWSLTVFIPFQSRKYNFKKDLESINQNVKVCYYNTTPVEGIAFLMNIFWRNKLGMPRPHNVLIPSIMIGIWMKYPKIKLLGADHSWLRSLHVDKENNALLNQKHFYDQGKSKLEPMNAISTKEYRRLHEILYKFMFTFKSYWEIKGFANKENVRIINETKDSFIDAFERG